MSTPVPPPPRVALRLFVMMVLQFFIWGAWLPLVWSYMGGLGFSGSQIALVGSTFAIASILGIFFGNQFVDRTFAAERFMAGSHLVGGLAMLGLYFTRSFPVFFALMLLHSICYVPTISVANALAFAHLRDDRLDPGVVAALFRARGRGRAGAAGGARCHVPRRGRRLAGAGGV